jgi:hypothetical protein
VIVSFFIWSCEDPTSLGVSKVFSNNKLQAAFADTFSVVSSVVQLDSVLTSGSSTVLLGKYRDVELGTIAASSYFQVGYSSQFILDSRFTFDSIVLVMPYNHTFVGDTTKYSTINLYELTGKMHPRTLPDADPLNIKTNVYTGTGFYNTSVIPRSSSPIVSKTVKFLPHRDTLSIRLPNAFGLRWFKFAQRSSESNTDSLIYQTNVSRFVTEYFRGFNIDVDPGTNACIVGFKTQRLKLRIYYKKYVGDFFKQTHFDFPVYSVDDKGIVYRSPDGTTDRLQFNHIDFDRSATPHLATLEKLKAKSTLLTGNMAFVQSGTGLVTRLDFPGVKDFFSIHNGIILNSAFLEFYPIRGSYTKNFLVPGSLQLYTTDQSNLPTTPIAGAVAPIAYDFEFGVNTVYRFQLFPYLLGQLRTDQNFITPVIIGPAANQGSSVQRVYLGDRFYTETKIKLKLYYTYALNN